ncbi:hypothetical protein XENORESO_006332 [Xenotaenia resolanae]|uniref:Uncharacterized protein n=1 Tax=Xenotaenia resolanae TaxID=208358 RepID=A0ABV0WRQ9_9TELE
MQKEDHLHILQPNLRSGGRFSRLCGDPRKSKFLLLQHVEIVFIIIHPGNKHNCSVVFFHSVSHSPRTADVPTSMAGISTAVNLTWAGCSPFINYTHTQEKPALTFYMSYQSKESHTLYLC